MPDHEIADSEEDSDPEIFASSEEPIHTTYQCVASKNGNDATSSPPSPGPSSTLGGRNAVPESASAEQRQRQIQELHKALIEPSPDSSFQQQSATSAMAWKKSPKKTSTEKDIYEFDASDDDHGVDLVATNILKSTVKWKRAKTSSTLIDLVGQDSGSEFETAPKKPQKKNNAVASGKKKRSKTMPAVPVFDESEDDWTPDGKAKVRHSKNKNGHPADRDFDSPAQCKRSRRQSAQGKNYFIPPPPGTTFSSDKETRATGEAQQEEGDKIEVCSNGVKGFVIELPNDVLPTQKKREYDAVSLPTQESPTSQPLYTGPRYDPVPGSMPDLQSTIPWDSQCQESANLPPLPSETLHPDFIQPGVHVESEPQPEPDLPKKQRARTDLGISSVENSMHVASEWRAAKGKGRTNLSDINRRAVSDNYLDELEHEFRVKPKKVRKPKEKKQSAKKSKKSEETTEAETTVVAHSTEVLHGDVKINTASIKSPATVHANEYTDDMVATAPLTESPALQIELNINSMKNARDSTSIDVAKDSDTSPGRFKRTKSRFHPDEDASNFDNEMEEIQQSAAKSTRDAGTKKKAGRKARRVVSDDEDGFSNAQEKGNSPLPNPPPPAKATTKRKRTKSGKKDDVEEDPVPEEELKSRKKAKKSDSKADLSAPVTEPATVPTEPLEEPTKPAATSISEMGHPPPVVATKTDRDRGTSKTPGPKTGAGSSKSPEIRRPGGLGTPIPIANKMRHRVGLSRKARIEPLLKIVKNKP